MTRLIKDDVIKIKTQIKEYDKIFKSQTGHTMEEIARIASGVNKENINVPTAVVPVTSGLGVISGFAKSVASILKHCGIDASVTKCTDVAGLQESYLSGRKLIFLADDDVFAAFGIGNKITADNGFATGQGYAGALVETMKSRGVSLKGNKVLVLGAGPVGCAAAQYLSKENLDVDMYDLDEAKIKKFIKKFPKIHMLKQLKDYSEYNYILDATTAADIITKEDVTAQTIIAVPGMPCGAHEDACDIATVIHNPLELGVLTMYYQCIAQENSLTEE